MAKRWKQQEITYLKRYSKVRLLRELAERFRTSTDEVEKKLKELQLASKDGYGYVPTPRDPLVKVYERGLQALHRNRWRNASKLFDRVLEESYDPELIGRARRFLLICNEKLGQVPQAKGEDPFLIAVYERNRGHLEEALEICSRGGRQSKDERFAYLAASIHALLDDKEKAAKFLALAIELNPKNRIHAFHDADFEEIRADPEYKQLFF